MPFDYNTTDNHDLPQIDPLDPASEDQWGQVLNEQGWARLDEKLIARDELANIDQFTPYDGAIFWATDSGEPIFEGDGAEWSLANMEVDTLTADAVSTEQTNTTYQPQNADQVKSVIESGDGKVSIPAGDYAVDNPITVSDSIIIEGAGRRKTTLKKLNDAPLIDITGGVVNLRDMRLDGINGTTDGIVVNSNRCHYQNLWVMNHGRDGVRHESGNVSTFLNISVGSNGRDGLVLDGGDTNGCSIINTNAKSNGRHGINHATGYGTTITGGYGENNGSYGLRLDGNHHRVYGFGGEGNNDGTLLIDTGCDYVGAILSRHGGYDNNGGTWCQVVQNGFGTWTTSGGHEYRFTDSGRFDAESLGSDRHYAGAFGGSDPDTRLDNALSAASGGDVIYLENALYDTDRTISTKVSLKGTFGQGVPSGHGVGPTIGANWSLDLSRLRINCVTLNESGSITINNSRCRLVDVEGRGSDSPITVNADEVIISECGGLEITFESGVAGCTVGTCVSTTASGATSDQNIGTGVEIV